MSTHKKIDLICVVVILVGLLITVLFMNGEALGMTVMYDQDTEAHEDTEFFSAKDLNPDWDVSAATYIKCMGSYAIISGSGAYVYDGNVYITGGGYYYITGELTDGSIIVDAHKNSKVWVMLDGVNVYASDTAAFQVLQADKVFLTLAEGSENVLASGGEFSSEAEEAGINAVIYAKDDLTINGYGTLTVNGGVKHGIKANDDLVITGGNISITVPGDGIHVNDSVRITEATITIEAGDDGIDQDEEDGYLYVASGTITIDCEDDAVNIAGLLVVDGGTITPDISAGAITSEEMPRLTEEATTKE
ncbi:MAG: carbohydrate-binding domain-containing protein [Lachnospiraceae bacterium]|nr:carbohydrate-binding domain-containing protein [Lachnospiraceae bacterium]